MPPHSMPAEEVVLGSLLLDEDAVFKVAAFLRPEDYFHERNRWTYEACLSLYERREAINEVTLAHELATCDRLEAVGGVAYLSYLVTAVPTSVFVERYAQIVQGTAMMRRLIEAAGRIAALVYEGGPDADVVLDKAEDILFNVRGRMSPQDFVQIRGIIDEHLQDNMKEELRSAAEAAMRAERAIAKAL